MKGKYKKSKKRSTKEIFNDIVDKFQTIVNNGEYEKFLKFQRNFDNGYSFNNVVLIYSQFPNATKVVGKAKWEKINRQVNADAKKIFILAPVPKKCTKKTTVIEDGEEVEKTQEIDYMTYRYVYVYDISQTTGDDIPLQWNKLNSNDMILFYEKLKKFSKLPVKEKEIFGSTRGFYSKKDQTITLEKTLSCNDKAAVLLHELSHALYDDFDYKENRNLSEIFVESIAYIVANHFGLDTSMCSFSYIVQWADGDPKLVIDLGTKIRKCANQFIKELEPSNVNIFSNCSNLFN